MKTIAALTAALAASLLWSVGAQAHDKILYIHNDHLGTPQAITDQNGTTVWKADYQPFGEAAADEDPDGNGARVVCNLRFPGQYYDQETGLHYNWHRDYDPATGRYLEADPSGIQEGRNHLYLYAEDDPVRKIDPNGLKVLMCWQGSHASIKIESSCNEEISGQWGFFPESGVWGGLVSVYWWVPGVVVRQSGGACYEVHGNDDADQQVFERIAQDILDPPCYSLPLFNCVNWAQDMWSGIGLHDLAMDAKMHGLCGR